MGSPVIEEADGSRGGACLFIPGIELQKENEIRVSN